MPAAGLRFSTIKTLLALARGAIMANTKGTLAAMVMHAVLAEARVTDGGPIIRRSCTRLPLVGIEG